MKMVGWKVVGLVDWMVVGWIGLVLVAIPLQGFVVFWCRQTGGSFFGQAGLECTLFPVAVELVVAIATAIHYVRVHADAVANPHNLIGKTLRGDDRNPPAPPPRPKVSDAWGGVWVDPAKASERMGKDR